MAKHQISVSIVGGMFSTVCDLEGMEVDLFPADDGFARKLEVDVEGDLDVFVHCKGLNGTGVNVTVLVDGNEVLAVDGTISKGFFRVNQAIALA